jgi:hypothetical protein
VVGVLFSFNSPDSDKTDAQILAWYADHGHRMSNVIGGYLLAVCGLFILWFVAGLRQHLRAAEGPGGRLSSVALGGGIALTALLWVGAAAAISISGAKTFGGVPGPRTADVARFVPQIGYASILVFGMFAAIAMIDATSVAALRTGILPRWFAWLGFVCAVVLLFAVVFLPMIALPIWLLCASLVFFKLPSIEAEPATLVPEP